MQELGERLVAVPEVALVELIKNAYDADASVCSVSLDGAGQMGIADDGHGMTFNQFQKFWMTIGTSHKAREEYSNATSLARRALAASQCAFWPLN
jgi:DNA mismatch repair ATPase MutL